MVTLLGRKREQDERKEKKIVDEAENVKKLRSQIEEDRANRAKQFETDAKQAQKAKDEKLKQIKNEQLKEEQEKLEEQRRLKDTMARVQVQSATHQMRS